MKDKAYNLMNKKDEASDKTTSDTEIKRTTANTTRTATEDLISKINREAPTTRQTSSAPQVDNIRQTEGGYLFDVLTTTNGEIIKDLFFPSDQIKSPRLEEAQERLIEMQQRQRRMIEFAIIYPAAIVSLIVIISGFMTILPKLQALF